MLSLHRLTKSPFGQMRRTKPGAPAASKLPSFRRTAATSPNDLVIRCPTTTPDETARDTHKKRGLFLARQERWTDLSAEIRAAERGRFTTPSGTMAADLLSAGARFDVVQAVEHALFEANPACGGPLLSGIDALEQMYAHAAEDVTLATVLAQAHMDIAKAWRGSKTICQLPARHHTAFHTHFDRARDILRRFNAAELRSPMLAAAICALHDAGTDTDRALSADFETWIDLNPINPRSMRTLGLYVSPHRSGSSQRLEDEAQRTAARTRQMWGTGGYTWVMFDALRVDAKAFENLDLALFRRGFNDILARNSDQHMVNYLAAYCALSMRQDPDGCDATNQTRAEISRYANWMVRTHLTELHPMIWAHAAHQMCSSHASQTARNFAASGRATGLRVLADLFTNEISSGHRIIFTAHGPVTKVRPTLGKASK